VTLTSPVIDTGERENAAAGQVISIVVQQVNFGGAEVHTLELMAALIEQGHTIELISNRYDGYDEIIKAKPWRHSVRIVHTDLSGIWYGEHSDRRGWREVFEQTGRNVLILVKANNNYGQLGFLRECRRAFRRIIFIEHSPFRAQPPRNRSWFSVRGLGLWWYKRWFLSWLGSRYADTIVAVSQKVRDRLVTDLRYEAKKVVVVRNGVPFRDFARNCDRGRESRQKHGIPSDAFVFGMMSRLSQEKGIDIALRALRLLVDQCPDKAFCLVIAGQGYLLEPLRDLTTQLGLHDRVKFIGFVQNPEAVFSAYDVILFSSRLEGLPLGLLQGMAAGCLPIVSRISDMPEAVPSEVGWVTEPENPSELCAAMKNALLLDTSSRSKMQAAVVERIRNHFDIARCNEQLVGLCIQ